MELAYFGAKVIHPQTMAPAVLKGHPDLDPQHLRAREVRVKLDEDREIRPFVDWSEVEAIAAEIIPAYRASRRSSWARACDQRRPSRSNGATSTGRRRRLHRARSLEGANEAVHEVRPPASAGATPGEGAGGARPSAAPRPRLVFPSRTASTSSSGRSLRHWTPALEGCGSRLTGAPTPAVTPSRRGRSTAG